MKEVFTKSEGYKSEYSAAIVRVGELIPIEGSDFLAKTLVFGTQIVVRKDIIKEGDLMLYASNETQINERFLSVNNMYEVSCRDKNANVDEVNKLYAPYIPIKEKADKLKKEAKNVKASMEQMSTRAKKYERKVEMLKTELEGIEDVEERNAKQLEIDETQKKADDAYAKALSKTTVYTNLKKEIEEIHKSGEHIVAEVKAKCGYMNKYGRVRCLTLRGTASFGLLLTMNALFAFDPTITMEEVEAYEGQEFDTINGELFCKVYVPPIPQENRRSNSNKAQKKVSLFDRMIEGEFFFHYDTLQFQKEIQNFKPEDEVVISVKLHGTSVCLGRLHVNQPIKLPFFKLVYNKIVDFLHLPKKIRITDTEVVYGPVYTSRTVIKNRYINKEVSGGYYGSDIWSEYGDIIYPYLSEGMTVYGEILGYLTGSQKMIQKAYDYGCKEGENKLMLYRITTTNDDGTKREWEVEEVYNWTTELISRMRANEDENYKKIHPIDILYKGTLEGLYPDLDTSIHWHEELLERMKNDKEHFGMEMNEPLCTNNEVPREGICIRKCNDERLECFKLKCYSFHIAEDIRMSENDVDIEMAEGYA